MSDYEDELYGGGSGTDSDGDSEDERRTNRHTNNKTKTITKKALDVDVEIDEEILRDDADDEDDTDDEDEDEDNEDEDNEYAREDEDNDDADSDAGEEDEDTMRGGDGEEDDEDGNRPTKKTVGAAINISDIIDEDDDYDELDENYLQKFDDDIQRNYIHTYHPECLSHNSDEVMKMAKVLRDAENHIVDPLHKTLPILTKYERARILGQRAKQIQCGSKPLVKVPENIIDENVIAELELREKKIPFIIRRPIPNGAFEYWHVRDLENIYF